MRLLARRPGRGSWTTVQPVARMERRGHRATTLVRSIGSTGDDRLSDRIPTQDGFSEDSSAPRRGFMSSSAAQLPRHRGGRCGVQSRSSAAEHRRRCNPSEVWAAQPAVAIVVAAEGVRTSATPFVALSASAVRHADVRPTGRADVRCPGDRCPRVRCDPGCPDSQASGVRGRCSRAVRIALDPGRRCGGTGRVWCTHVRCIAVVGEWLGRRCPNRAWREGWSNVGRGWLARVSTADLGRRFAGAPAAAPCSPGWPINAAGPAPGAGRLAGGAGRSGRAQRFPAGVLGRLPA
jgi:hypothetical protein